MGYQENWLPYFQSELGHEVLILTSDKYFPFPDYDKNVGSILGKRRKGVGKFQCKGINITRARSFFEASSKASILFNIKREVEGFDPDVIHVHGITNLNIFQTLWCTRKKNIKVFVDSHSDYQVSNYKSKFNRLYYKSWSAFYYLYKKKIACFLPTTNEGKFFLINEFSIPKESIEINFLGVNVDRFYYDSERKEDLQNKYNLKGRRVIINAGKQDERKRILFILDVFRELVIEYGHGELTLMLVGSASDEYDKLICEKVEKIPDNIIRIPFLENSFLKDYYSLADLGIWPGVPSNTIQEAMACEVSVILPRNDTISHLIEDNGFFLSSFDYKEVASNISQLICSGLLDQYKKNSRELAVRFSWKCIAKESLKIYESR